MLHYSFRLFVSDAEGKDREVIAIVQSLCAARYERDFELAVVDVSCRPELAEQDKVMATPTLVRVLPLPTRSAVGDLADEQQVLRTFSLWEEATGSEPPKDLAGAPNRPR